MPFEIVRNDIANMTVDAIVNAAHHRPKVGVGVDSALHQKAGPALLAAAAVDLNALIRGAGESWIAELKK